MAEEKKVETAAGLRPVTDIELKTAFSGPSIHSNRMFATNTVAGMRLAFCEEAAELGQIQFRTSVIVSYPDAVALRDLLTKQLSLVRISVTKQENEPPNG